MSTANPTQVSQPAIWVHDLKVEHISGEPTEQSAAPPVVQITALAEIQGAGQVVQVVAMPLSVWQQLVTYFR